MKNFKVSLLSLIIIFLLVHVISDVFKESYDCNKRGGVMVRKMFWGYSCIKKIELEEK